MKTKAGLWIDHQEAVIVELVDETFRMQQVKSHVEKQLRRTERPDGIPVANGTFPPDDSREREYKGHLVRYYDDIISRLESAGEIFIFGPGEARCELAKRLAKIPGDKRLLSLEKTDKMTSPEIVAHVRKYFHRAAARGRGTTSNLVQPSPLTEEKLCSRNSP